jgi:pre-mRNA-splicing factor RBM22/SLT11
VLQIIKGKKLMIRWGKSQAKQTSTITSGEGVVPNIPGLPGALPPPPQHGEVLRNDFFNLAPPSTSANFFLPPPGMSRPPPGLLPPGGPIHYPSQDPSRMGAMQPHIQQ